MSTQQDYRGESLNKVWLKRYPADVPAEINADRYRSLVDLFEQAVSVTPGNLLLQHGSKDDLSPTGRKKSGLCRLSAT